MFSDDLRLFVVFIMMEICTMKTENIELNEQPGRKILVVENDFHRVRITERSLMNYFEVNTETNGYAALEVMEAGHYDAVIMDINLGDESMDGLRTMRLIKQNPKYKRVKVFVMSTFDGARDWYIKQGFDDLLLKPMEGERVAKLIADKLVTNFTRGRSLLLRKAELV